MITNFKIYESENWVKNKQDLIYNINLIIKYCGREYITMSSGLKYNDGDIIDLFVDAVVVVYLNSNRRLNDETINYEKIPMKTLRKIKERLLILVGSEIIKFGELSEEVIDETDFIEIKDLVNFVGSDNVLNSHLYSKDYEFFHKQQKATEFNL